MRGIRTSVVSILALGLLAGSAAGVRAQDDESVDRVPPTEFSTFIECFWAPHVDADITNAVVGSVEGGNLVLREEHGRVWRSPEFEASDPRLSGRYLLYVHSDRYVTPDVAIEDSPLLETIVVRVENEDGAWQGTGHSGSWPNDPRGVSWEPAILRGEGHYAGLTVLWLDRFSQEPCGWEVKGVVFDGELPAFPEPPAE